MKNSKIEIQQALAKLEGLRKSTQKEHKQEPNLEHVLKYFHGSKYSFKYQITKNILSCNFSEINDQKQYEFPIFTDQISGEQTCFMEIPIEYLFHDYFLNPRNLNKNVNSLLKEFSKGNPQLHTGLVRLDNGKLKIFDGQHKTVCQILLGAKRLLFRVFLNPNLNRLLETNTNAGSALRQVEFDKSSVRGLNQKLYSIKQSTSSKKDYFPF